MAPARSADSVWHRLGRSVTGSAPVTWIHDNVLHHPHIARGRGMAREGWSRVLDVCYPLIVLIRGTRRGASILGAWWKGAAKDKRRLQSVIAIACLIGVGLLRFGPVILILAFLCTAAWLGRDTSRKGADPESAGHIGRLQSVYNGLVPYLQNGDDPDQHFKPGGGYRDAFTAWEFDEQDRLIRLRMDYSEYFRDGEADSRAKVERALEGKIGHSNEYLYAWDEAGNHLDVRILPPLPDGIGAQPWPVADIEFVLGVTDPGSAGRLIPVLVADPEAAEDTLTPLAAARDEVPPGFKVTQLAPVVWRLGEPSANPHLLLSGAPASGKSTAVRSLIGQALARGHRVAVIDTDQTAEYGALAGRPNVLRVTEEPADSLDLLDWCALELERRAERAALSRRHSIGSRAVGAAVGASAAADAEAAPEGAHAAQGAVMTAEASETMEPGTAGVTGDSGERAQPDGEPPLWLFVDDLP
ncbi:MAG: FtsK/SpoIIIE domain-containing protein, partial [Actinocrinis sp.]